MKVNKVLYAFEHKVLPRMFYEKPEIFIISVLSKNNVLFAAFDQIMSKEGLDNPYKEEDFSSELLEVSDDIVAVRLNYPEPKEKLHCYRSYALINKDSHQKGFFCIEKPCADEAKQPFLCSWSNEGAHSTHADCPPDKEEEIKICAEALIDCFDENGNSTLLKELMKK